LSTRPEALEPERLALLSIADLFFAGLVVVVGVVVPLFDEDPVVYDFNRLGREMRTMLQSS
jgi:hypothetical protein